MSHKRPVSKDAMSDANSPDAKRLSVEIRESVSPAIEVLLSGSLPSATILDLSGIRDLTQTVVPDCASVSTECSEAGSTIEDSAESSLVQGRAASEFLNAPTRCIQTHTSQEMWILKVLRFGSQVCL